MITELSECEIFVFGSNLAGQHGGGAARMAYRHFGAEWGVGVGLTGKCYAIPTMHGGLDAIRPYVDDFIRYAKEHPNNRFLLTRVGCGIAGFKDRDMAELFKEALEIPNITIPKEWLPTMLIDITLGLATPKGHEVAPDVIDEKVLRVLCEKHLYEIGAGIDKYLPHITIRYVIDRDKFGYAKFGDFFFCENDLYVWHTHDGWGGDHNQDMVENVFGDECKGRGYACRAIFAGVKTNFTDVNGDAIYTGDVLQLKSKLEDSGDYVDPVHQILAVGSMNDNEGRGAYTFLLDNHDWSLRQAAKDYTIERVGTVFYQLDWCDEPVSVNRLTMDFIGWRDTKEDRLKKALMSRYTPNFDKEEWKYEALDILGAEFNWRK